eukprot:CAMPEP_0182546168 /NCGR_PEP_ID=MMETSP1323-20130603/35619_1 /TAXON_ID=236787 /ORGANISM="Florenciella parvula, Strain RCC1693" /LENGTH=46 /DNA_ID= /DNA_START= /DNA_END= /DNA_ORIENTATION=
MHRAEALTVEGSGSGPDPGAADPIHMPGWLVARLRAAPREHLPIPK